MSSPKMTAHGGSFARLVRWRKTCYTCCVGRKGLRRSPRKSVQESEVRFMSDFEMISVFLMILSFVVVLLKKDK